MAIKEIGSAATPATVCSDVIDSIWSLLLLHMIGLPDGYFCGLGWYLSSMLIALAFLTPFYFWNRKAYLQVVAPIVLLISSVCMDMLTNGNAMGSGSVREWTGIMYFGTIRAFAGISAGAIVWSAANELSRCNLSNKSQRLFLTMLEVFGYVVVFVRSFTEVSGKTTYLLVGITAVSIALTKSQLTYTALVPSGMAFWLGRISFTIYLLQMSAIFLVFLLAQRTQLFRYDYHEMLPWYIVTSLILGILLDSMMQLFHKDA